MRNLTRLLMLVGIIVASTSAAPPDAVAQEEEDDGSEAITCTLTYEKCLDAAAERSEPFATMAEIECFAGWIGCVKDKVW